MANTKTTFWQRHWEWVVAIVLGTCGNILLLGITYGSLTTEMKQQRKDIDQNAADIKADRTVQGELKVSVAEIRTDVKWLRQQKEAEKGEGAQARGK